MEKWHIALDKFLNEWKENQDVIGALVCGSYVTGNPSQHSDIDLHIILKDGTQWRERGNKIIEGFLIEYFANPPKQIVKYFEDDFKDGTHMATIQFLTGKILFDDGTIEKLKEAAKAKFITKFEKMPDFKVELNKYGLWDNLDNLRDVYEENKPYFMFVYHNSLYQTIECYFKYLGYRVTKYEKVFGVLTSEITRTKYLLNEFPDKKFSELCARALIEKDREQAMKIYAELVNYVLGVLGGFEIDGWKLRSQLDL